jgi:hypothetical protein
MRWKSVALGATVAFAGIAFVYFLYTGIIAAVSSLTPAGSVERPASAPEVPVAVGTPMWVKPSAPPSNPSAAAKAPLPPPATRPPGPATSHDAVQQGRDVRRGPGGNLRR